MLMLCNWVKINIFCLFLKATLRALYLVSVTLDLCWCPKYLSLLFSTSSAFFSFGWQGDNDFEYLSPEIGNLRNLQIVRTEIFKIKKPFFWIRLTVSLSSFQLVLRDNDLIMLPAELGMLTKLRELHIQGNRLTILPPELGALDLTSQRYV